MRLTMRRFKRIYDIYKDDFDLEMLLRTTRTTYRESLARQQREEEWF